MEIKIVLDKELLNDKDFDFFHYENSYELAKCEYGTFYIASRGELKCTYIDIENDIETQDYIDIIRHYVRNNAEYLKAIDNQLILDLGNWFEIEFYTNGGEYICLTDECFGSISECLDTFTEIIKDKEIMADFEKEVLANE